MTHEEKRDGLKAFIQRRDTLYQWYTEKQTKGFHKEYTFEWLKSQILNVENAIEKLAATETENSL